jgi:hypothetical protein
MKKKIFIITSAAIIILTGLGLWKIYTEMILYKCLIQNPYVETKPTHENWLADPKKNKTDLGFCILAISPDAFDSIRIKNYYSSFVVQLNLHDGSDWIFHSPIPMTFEESMQQQRQISDQFEMVARI